MNSGSARHRPPGIALLQANLVVALAGFLFAIQRVHRLDRQFHVAGSGAALFLLHAGSLPDGSHLGPQAHQQGQVLQQGLPFCLVAELGARQPHSCVSLAAKPEEVV